MSYACSNAAHRGRLFALLWAAAVCACTSSAAVVTLTGTPAEPLTEGTFVFQFTVTGTSAPPWCKLDRASIRGSFAPCESLTSHTVTGLRDGAYVFTVAVLDDGGTVASAHHAFTVSRNLTPVDVHEWARWTPTADPPLESSFTVAEETVSDATTGLLWQRRIAAAGGRPALLTWPAASEACTSLALGGEGGWRLPTLIELLSIVDATRHDRVASPAVFADMPASALWTASRYADGLGGSSQTWVVDFASGASSPSPVTAQNQARCVRGGAMPQTPHYTISQVDVVRDNWSGLVWQRGAPARRFGLEEGQVYCAGLSLGGAFSAGWRLPTLKELQTLVDVRVASPAIDASAFPGTPSDTPFWTSTRDASNGEWGWFVNFNGGSSAAGAALRRPNYLRCVNDAAAEQLDGGVDGGVGGGFDGGVDGGFVGRR